MEANENGKVNKETLSFYEKTHKSRASYNQKKGLEEF